MPSLQLERRQKNQPLAQLELPRECQRRGLLPHAARAGALLNRVEPVTNASDAAEKRALRTAERGLATPAANDATTSFRPREQQRANCGVRRQ